MRSTHFRCFSTAQSVRPVENATASAGGSARILDAFARCKTEGRAAFVAYTTVGFPTQDATLDVLQALQAGGADVIELGVPFTDPLADGPTIQRSNQRALDGGVSSVSQVLSVVKTARANGVTVPIVLMGYYNPFYMHGENKLMADCREAGVDGFIVVDLPPEEAEAFRSAAEAQSLSYIPLVAPTTTDDRIQRLTSRADSFVYAVSMTGVTGARDEGDGGMGKDIEALLGRIRAHTDAPVAIGFGISTPEQFETVSKIGDGVIVGSAIINAVSAASKNDAPPAAMQDSLRKFCTDLTGRTVATPPPLSSPAEAVQPFPEAPNPPAGESSSHRFGEFGGRFVSEILMEPLEELEEMYNKVRDDPVFVEECQSFYSYIGRPTPLHRADRLTDAETEARIWLKREDLNHTGAHKINNAISQALLAKRLGKKRIIAETGAGQHGVATATACAKLNLECVVYMGATDVERQALNVFRMEMLGAKVVAVDSGSRTLKDAINEAMRDWVTNIRDTHYLVGSAIGPHPFPTIVRDFQSVIGRESRQQMLDVAGKLPDAVVACVGGGSNAIGMFHPFKDDQDVRLIGVEAAGDGVDTKNHSATLALGTPGVLHGTRTYLLQDKTGQIAGTHSISAGLDYPGVGPEHAFFKSIGRAEYKPVNDREALLGFKAITMREGIIPALETAHAVYQAVEEAKELGSGKDVLICLSGRGDKDINTIRKALPNFGCKLNVRSIPE